jgi:LacI family transcriptional regulator
MRAVPSHATLTDVAREARVGTTTVSRVINGGERVSPATLERVQKVIQRLGYQPNHAARILKGESTRTLGLIVPSVADSFFSTCAEAAQKVSRLHHFLLIVTSSNNHGPTELENLNVLIQHRVDGVLIAPAVSHNKELVEVLKRTAIPVVSFDRPIYNSSVPSVVSNNYKGAWEATRHLLSHGYKRIICFGFKGEDSLYTIKERIRGYRQAIKEAKLTAEVDMSISDCESAELAVRTHLQGPNPPDAIFALKNLATIYTCEALQKMDIPVPATIALIGFDDFELASTLNPSITVVKQQIEQIGEVATTLLFEQVKARKKSGVRGSQNERNSETTRLETELILRNSCGCGRR